MSGNTKYKEILLRLEEKIKNMESNSKLPSMRKLMQEFNVSQSPLDNALRLLEHKQYIRRVQRDGIYVSPRKLRQYTGSIGLVVSDVTDPFCSFVIKGIQGILSEANYNMLLCNSHNELKRELNLLRSLDGKIDALIIFPYTFHAINPEYISYFKEFKANNDIPIVTVNMQLPRVNTGLVDFNNFACMRSIAKTLIRKRTGSKIVTLYSVTGEVSIQRTIGIKSLLNEMGILDQGLFINGDLKYSDFRVMLDDALLKNKGEEWIFLNTYPPALSPLIEWINKNKIKVPEQAFVASVVEENDYKDKDHDVPIITIEKNGIKLGAESARIVLKAIRERNSETESATIDMNLVIPDKLASLISSKK